MTPIDHRIPARDGYPLAATEFPPHQDTDKVVVINSATAVPRRFYRHFATALANAGYRVLTYDYRGIGGSRPKSLRGFEARARDWFQQDMAGVVDWVLAEWQPARLFFVGHSFGGQTAGLLDNAEAVDGMVTLSAQSGNWRMQGGEQKLVVLLHTWLTLPLVTRLVGYMPWSYLGAGEDLPAGVASEWAGWCRHADYILGDDSLPLERYQDFTAPVLAYSIGDDKWGTPRSVDAMMRAYPNLERRHIDPDEAGIDSIGHVGYFRPASKVLWAETIDWLDGRG